MKQVVLKPLYHIEQESIGIYFKNDASLKIIVRKLTSVKWSQTNKCWYVPLNAEAYKQLKNLMNGEAVLEPSALKEYLNKRKKVIATFPAPSKKINTTSPVASAVWKLSKENLTALEKFVEHLKLKAYSTSTILFRLIVWVKSLASSAAVCPKKTFLFSALAQNKISKH